MNVYLCDQKKKKRFLRNLKIPYLKFSETKGYELLGSGLYVRSLTYFSPREVAFLKYYRKGDYLKIVAYVYYQGTCTL